MKTNKSKYIAAAAMAAMLASCGENTWNNQLDGFEGGADNSQVETVSYTLTATDYARAADNRFNQALAKEHGVSDELAAVKSLHYFTNRIPAAEYIPNLLKDSLFAYYGLSDGSAINLTYNQVGQDLPEILTGLNAAKSYTVSESDYQEAYGSTEDYAPAFAPSYPAASYIPAILGGEFGDAEKGDYVLVSYNQSDVDPNFETRFELSSVIGNSLQVGSEVEVNGIITAECTRGFILTDKGGSILVYSGDYAAGTYSVGQLVNLKGSVASFKNCLQIDYNSAVITPMGSDSKYEYPNPVELTADYLVAANANQNPVTAVYGVMTGTISVSGNYVNVVLDGTTAARGSIYYASDDLKAKLQDGVKYTLYGYFTQTSTSGDTVNANFVVVDVNAAAKSPRRVVSIPSNGVYAVYTFNGSRWEAVTGDVCVLQPSDYAAMGVGSYNNLSGEQPAQFLPVLLRQKYPYATADKQIYVVYRWYESKVTSVACAQYTYDGSDWIDSITTNGVETVTSQFVRRDGVWQLDPSVELTLPAGRNQPLSTWFFQACVDWVKDNVPDGSKFISSYGNNDYYTGASAYQGNFDFRASKAREQFPEYYQDMTDEQVVETMQEHFTEQVGPGALAVLYPDMSPIGALEPTVTINFSGYNGDKTLPGKCVFKCVANKKFEIVSFEWPLEE